MNIELTPQEAQFIYENIAQLNVPISNPNGATIHTVANSVLAKIKAEAEKGAEPALPDAAEILGLDEKDKTSD